MIRSVILTGADAVAFGESHWPSITGPVFVSRSWVLAAWRRLPELGLPAVVLVKDGDDWCGLAGHMSGGEFAVAGAPLGDEHDVVATCSNTAVRLVPHVVRALSGTRSVRKIVLDCLVPDGVLARAVLSDQAWQVIEQISPVLRPSPDAGGKGAVRRLRRLARSGAVVIDTIEGPQLTEDVVLDFLRRRYGRWAAQGRAGQLPPIEKVPGFRRFFAEAVAELARLDRARLVRMLVGDRVAAQDVYLGDPAEPLLYMRDFELEFASSSPGKVLLEQTLREMGATNVRRVRTGRGDEQYKLDLGGDSSVVVQVVRSELQSDAWGSIRHGSTGVG